MYKPFFKKKIIIIRGFFYLLLGKKEWNGMFKLRLYKERQLSCLQQREFHRKRAQGQLQNHVKRLKHV
jgi:hypothetical protein